MQVPFDLIVLGAGSGGLAAAKRAALHGARVAIVEGDRVAERSKEIDAIAPECSYAFICGVLYTRWDRSWVSPDGEYELTRTPKGWTDEPWLED